MQENSSHHSDNHFEINENNKGKILCKTDIQGKLFVFTIFPTNEGPSGANQKEIHHQVR